MFAAKESPPEDAAASCRPVTFAAPARIGSNLRQESRQGGPFVFSRLRTLLRAQILQATYFQLLPHSSPQERKLTPAFSARSALFLRSSAQERKSTPLFSGACALFCRTTGGRGTAAKENLSTMRHLRPAIRHDFTGAGCTAARAKRVWAVLAARVERVRAVLAARVESLGSIMGVRGFRSRKARNSVNNGHESKHTRRIAA